MVKEALIYYPSRIKLILYFLGAGVLAVGSFYYLLSSPPDSPLRSSDFFWIFPFVLFFLYINKYNRSYNKILNVVIFTLIFLLSILFLGNKAIGLTGLLFFGGGAVLFAWKVVNRRPSLVLNSNGIGFDKGFFRIYKFFSLDKIAGFRIEKLVVPYLFPIPSRVWSEEFLEIKLKNGSVSSIHISDLNKNSNEIKKEVSEFTRIHNISFKNEN